MGFDPERVRILGQLAPGTGLREAIENILRAGSGGLIVMGDDEVDPLVEGGFQINCTFTPARLYELAKMDGAIVVSRDLSRIRFTNVQLVPDGSIPSSETGIRHRTAERAARQTGALVIAVSQRRGLITVYQGTRKFVLQDLAMLLTKANQALQTLQEFRWATDHALAQLTWLELEEAVTVMDAARALQRASMLLAVAEEVGGYVVELGSEGGLVARQRNELMHGMEAELLDCLADYVRPGAWVTPDEERQTLRLLTELGERMPDALEVSRQLGLANSVADLEKPLAPRGWRILHRIPRLPMPVVENLVRTMGKLPQILSATPQELDEIEGIGEARARAIYDGLRHMREHARLQRQ